MSQAKASHLELENQLALLVKKISEAESILLTTHKQCDGDGLGAMVALYYALKKINKKVRIFSVDEVPRKYQFLGVNDELEIYENTNEAIGPIDLTLIFDTNDSRLVEPLFSELTQCSSEVFFVDHHPELIQGPAPTKGSYIDITAASTGEITYYIIKGLKVPLDKNIARSLYMSIAFDTQVFRFIRNSPRSHLVAADLLKYEHNPEEIHRNLFATQTIGKMGLLAQSFSTTEFIGPKKEIALLKITTNDLQNHDQQPDDSRDILDMIMNIQTVEIGALLLESKEGGYKLSLRSRGTYNIVKIAEYFGGGGHAFSAGAYIRGNYQEIHDQAIEQIKQTIK